MRAAKNDDSGALPKDSSDDKRAGCHIEIWSDKNFQGEYVRIEGPIECQALRFPNRNWGSSISSLRVGPTAFVLVYADENFNGAMMSFGPGQEVANLDELSFNDEIDSIRLVNSLKVFDGSRVEDARKSIQLSPTKKQNKRAGRRKETERQNLSRMRVLNLDANKAIVRRFFEDLWNNRKLAVADELFASECITHQLRFGNDAAGVPRGPEAMWHHVAEWLAAFPDIHYTINQMLAEGDRVMTQCVARGTHSGTWLGIPATGKVITIQILTVHRIADGKITEDWVLVDSLGVFQQLGVVPPIAELIAAAGAPRD